MKEENRERLSAFVRALEASGRENSTLQAACHHSAVEVNDWHAIQAAMKQAGDAVAGSQTAERKEAK